MLVQISEPASFMSTEDNKNAESTLVLGIDFGTTNSLAARVVDGEPTVISYNNEPLMPSALNKDGITIRSIKKLLGKTYRQIMSSPGIGKDIKSLIVEENDEVYLDIAGKYYTPLELGTEVFSNLLARCKASLKSEYSNTISAVITVPAYFDDYERSMVARAAQNVGIEVMRIIAEPTAAAYAYGLQNIMSRIDDDALIERCSRYVVYDLGGGTFDVSLVEIYNGLLKVVSTIGDTCLGGDNIDLAIYHYLLGKYSAALEDYSMQVLLPLCTQAKIALGDSKKTVINVPNTAIGNIECELEKEELEYLARHVLSDTIELLDQLLMEYEVSKTSSSNIIVDGVILIGGATKMPLVKQMISERFPYYILSDIDPDCAVALGAAMHAHNLSVQKMDNIMDVSALSIGIETATYDSSTGTYGNGLVDKVITRGSSIPSSVTRSYTTCTFGQTAMKFHIVQGDREFAKDCRSLGIFELKGLPSLAPGVLKVEVTFSIDANGLLNVVAVETTTGISAEMQTNSVKMTEENTRECLIDAMRFAESDHNARLIAEFKNEIFDILKSVRHTMQIYVEVLNQQHLDTLQKLQEDLDKLLKSDVNTQNIREMDEYFLSLKASFDEVMSVLLDHGIQVKLKGKKIEVVNLNT